VFDKNDSESECINCLRREKHGFGMCEECKTLHNLEVKKDKDVIKIAEKVNRDFNEKKRLRNAGK